MSNGGSLIRTGSSPRVASTTAAFRFLSAANRPANSAGQGIILGKRLLRRNQITQVTPCLGVSQPPPPQPQLWAGEEACAGAADGIKSKRSHFQPELFRRRQ